MFGKQPDAIVSQRGNDGTVRVLESKGGTIERPQGITAKAKPEAAAEAHLTRYASAFGVQSEELSLAKATDLGDGSAVRFDRSVDGIDVFGGQVVVSLDSLNNLEFIVGETGGKPQRSFPTLDLFGESKLANAAKQVVARREKLGSTSGLEVESEGRAWYDGKVLGVPDAKGIEPVYSYKVHSENLDISYQVLVNAATRKTEIAYSLVQHAINRVVCDAESQVVEEYACDGETVAYARTEGDAPSAVDDVNKVYDYFHDTSVRFSSYINTDVTQLIGTDYGDGQGKALRATVRVCTTEACPYENAFWDGEQMVFGEGVTTDDITAHELAHGVTQQTSNLAYIFQSGAINEGLSDFWGEMVDINNGSDDDNADTRWQIGEGSSLGVIRDMQDPGSLGQPDRMTSPDFFDGTSFEDNGGVHYNSGVFNKAIYLMTDGEDFNGYQIRGLGPAKTAKIGWTLQNLLPPGADYKDVFYTLPLSCRKNIGRAGSYITEDDCQQVDKVVRATEMYKDPVQGSAQNVDYCEDGLKHTPSYVQGFESKNDGWTFQGNWFLSNEVGFYRYAAVGEEAAVAWSLAGDDISLTQSVAVEIPADAFIRYDHAYLLDDGDGAALEYSEDNGFTWKPAADLPNVNGEDVPVDTLGGADSFAGNSLGFGGTRYDASSLAGKSVKFRFHSAVATDNSAWWVDNFKIYNCG
ncbi:M4 family metallopeptidase [Actinopolymorpha sp. B9G3]|uniref:M4 family metallopeptidase n=1 Tax=Actinopolymorpha sp. B9G3 TaxID=3158970 RepID=UPI0032D98BFC